MYGKTIRHYCGRLRRLSTASRGGRLSFSLFTAQRQWQERFELLANHARVVTRLDREQANLWAALEWSMGDGGDRQIGLRLAGALLTEVSANRAAGANLASGRATTGRAFCRSRAKALR